MNGSKGGADFVLIQALALLISKWKLLIIRTMWSLYGKKCSRFQSKQGKLQPLRLPLKGQVNKHTTVGNYSGLFSCFQIKQKQKDNLIFTFFFFWSKIWFLRVWKTASSKLFTGVNSNVKMQPQSAMLYYSVCTAGKEISHFFHRKVVQKHLPTKKTLNLGTFSVCSPLLP